MVCRTSTAEYHQHSNDMKYHAVWWCGPKGVNKEQIKLVNLSIIMLWSTMSNKALKSSRTSTEHSPASAFIKISLITLTRAVSLLCCLPETWLKFPKMFLPIKTSNNWFETIFSGIFDIKGYWSIVAIVRVIRTRFFEKWLDTSGLIIIRKTSRK